MVWRLFAGVILLGIVAIGYFTWSPAYEATWNQTMEAIGGDAHRGATPPAE